MLAFRKEETEEQEALLESAHDCSAVKYTFTSTMGWILILIGILQCITGIAAQALPSH